MVSRYGASHDRVPRRARRPADGAARPERGRALPGPRRRSADAALGSTRPELGAPDPARPARRGRGEGRAEGAPAVGPRCRSERPADRRARAPRLPGVRGRRREPRAARLRAPRGRRGLDTAMGEPFSHTLRVRYAECDPQGVVFNAHYLAYFDASITELWRAAFGGYRVMMDRGVDLVVAEAELRFRTPARLDDELTLDVSVTRIGHTAITSGHRISRGTEVVVEGTLRHVVVDLATLTKMP